MVKEEEKKLRKGGRGGIYSRLRWGTSKVGRVQDGCKQLLSIIVGRCAKISKRLIGSRRLEGTSVNGNVWPRTVGSSASQLLHSDLGNTREDFKTIQILRGPQ